MVSFRSVVALGAISLSVANGLAIDSSVPHGYKMVELSWEVRPFLDNRTVIINGTVERVFDELLEINPQYMADFAAMGETAITPSAEPVDAQLSGKLPRPLCDWGNLGAKPGVIREGIRYLRTILGAPALGPGPHECGQVSCSFSSAITWCNDRKENKKLESFSDIADLAQIILDKCAQPNGRSVYGSQTYSDYTWYVRVHGRDDPDGPTICQ
ncbi:hypothetical protein JX266_007426 [Neoarthrinium moseri]|nr:hypothetical protein JX266_007426 [Neoarthrinium moseri]